MKITLAGIAAVATAIIGVASANAGTFAVNIDAWHNGAGCNLFAIWGSVNEFSWDAPCNGYPMSVGGPEQRLCSGGHERRLSDERSRGDRDRWCERRREHDSQPQRRQGLGRWRLLGGRGS